MALEKNLNWKNTTRKISYMILWYMEGGGSDWKDEHQIGKN